MEVKFLGKTFGTGSGWDQVDDSIIYFYEVKSEDERFNGFDLAFDYMKGIIEIYNSNTRGPRRNK